MNYFPEIFLSSATEVDIMVARQVEFGVRNIGCGEVIIYSLFVSHHELTTLIFSRLTILVCM